MNYSDIMQQKYKYGCQKRKILNITHVLKN